MTSTKRERARPLSAGERRAAIIEATLPLLAQHGGGVTTRQIAEAAGIAEGTIFRVFDDKRSLFLAVAEEAMNPPGARAEMAAQLSELSVLHDKVRLVVERLVERLEQGMLVMMALRSMLMAEGGPSAPSEKAGPPAFVRRANEELTRNLTDLLFTPHADELRMAPDRAALVLRSLVFGAWHPGMPHGEHGLSPGDVADVLLEGVRRHAGPTQPGASQPGPTHPSARQPNEEDNPC